MLPKQQRLLLLLPPRLPKQWLRLPLRTQACACAKMDGWATIVTAKPVKWIAVILVRATMVYVNVCPGTRVHPAQKPACVSTTTGVAAVAATFANALLVSKVHIATNVNVRLVQMGRNVGVKVSVIPLVIVCANLNLLVKVVMNWLAPQTMF